MSKERREARRAFYEKKEKEAYRLLKRINEIGPLAHRHFMGTQMVELENPIRHGWVRFYKVRDDVARSPEGPMLAEVLSFVQKSVRCDRKDFMKKTLRKKNEYKPVEQELAFIHEREFLEKVPERLHKFFYKCCEISKWGGQPFYTYMVWQTWKFEFVVKPYYITKVPMTSSEAESEYKKLSDKMWRQDNLTMKYMDHPSEPKDYQVSAKTKRAKERAKLRKEAAEALDEMQREREEEREDAYYRWLDN